MSTQLDPLISEFETQEQADSYDRWFRTKVQAALDSEKPALPHAEAMAKLDRLIEERRRQRIE
ncbi:stability determinant [uncultured Halomonas sp.]|uniref:type II toxin-antitoxin system RelB family antitoxin n=1 Tax=uncultured Halomonas sp. TaxID=173971 RepID=UPI0026091F3B|nr:stability determinant [uncultured Halomonas sp.]